MRIVVTAGPTREPIDPVRFISNRSTGYMGYLISEEASKRKHRVALITGPTELKPPDNVKKIISIETSAELLSAVRKEISNADCLVMCAAVGDFKPKRKINKKIKKKKELTLTLKRTPDILSEISKRNKAKLLTGFSLETENLLKSSEKKLKKKNLDLLVANAFTKTHNPFGNNKLDVYFIYKNGKKELIKGKYKPFIANLLLDKIEELWYLKR